MATYTKRGNKWFAQVCKGGIRKSATFPTKGAAKAWATELEVEIGLGRYRPQSGVLFRDALDRYLKDVSPNKACHYIETRIVEAVKKLPMADLPLDSVTTAVLAQWRDELLKTLKPNTVLRKIAVLSNLFDIAVKEWQIADTNPCKGLKMPTPGKPRDRIFSEEEIMLVIENAKPPFDSVFALAIETGMRLGEIASLEWVNINLDARTALLPKTKNGDKRTVPLSAAAIAILEKHKDGDKPFRFHPPRGSNYFNDLFKRVGIENAVFHDTRHTAITTRLSKKLDPFQLARMVGHRNMNQTLAYYNESAEEIAKKL